MAFNAQEFRANFIDDFARQNYYEVIILPPKKLFEKNKEGALGSLTSDLVNSAKDKVKGAAQAGINFIGGALPEGTPGVGSATSAANNFIGKVVDNFQVFDDKLGVDRLRFACSETTLPGRTVKTVDTLQNTAKVKYAAGADYAEVKLTFLISSNMEEKVIFDEWCNLITNHSDGDPGAGHIEYYENYIGEVWIRQYNHIGLPVYTCRLIEAYPSAMGDLTLGWDNRNTIHKLQVTFAYRHWERKESVSQIQTQVEAESVLRKVGKSKRIIENLI